MNNLEFKATAAAWRRRAGAAYRRLPRPARRIVVGLVGGIMVLAGAALLLLPGPGLLTIAVGVGILAVEFHWVRRLLAVLRRRATGVRAGR